MNSSRSFLLMLGMALLIPSFGQETKTHFVKSEQLDEKRLIWVHLPASYERSTKEYPVLWLLDGEWIFPYATGSVDFLTNDLNGLIPEMIVIGIPNTIRERDLSTFGEEYLDFAAFLTDNLMPFIRANYRASSYDIIYGFSSGSGFSTQFLIDYPEVFDAYIQCGAGLGPNDYKYARSNLQSNSYNNVRVYTNCEGDSEVRIRYLKRYEHLMDSLSLDGIDYTFEILEEENHVSAMSYGLYRGLKYIFEPFQLPANISEQGTEAVKSYYRDVGERFDFEVIIPQGMIIETASNMSYADKFDEALELVDEGLRLYPGSDRLLGIKAELLKGDGRINEALGTLKEALKNTPKEARDRANKYRALILQLENQDN